MSLAAVVRTKVSDARTVRRIALEGHRFPPQEALDCGLIDVVADGGSSEAVFSAARALAIEKSLNAKTGVWGLIKVQPDLTAIFMPLSDADPRKKSIDTCWRMLPKIIGRSWPHMRTWLPELGYSRISFLYINLAYPYLLLCVPVITFQEFMLVLSKRLSAFT